MHLTISIDRFQLLKSLSDYVKDRFVSLTETNDYIIYILNRLIF